jgi:Undecaprenyl-phosphate galactose phosphotransferase WbaP
MRSVVGTENTLPEGAPSNLRYLKAGALPGRRAEAWRQRLVNFTLILSDTALAIAIWEVAFILQSVWGRGPLLEITVAGVLPSVMVWLGLRTLLGLYPGYGLGSVEELRRQTYAVLATLAIIATVAIVLQVGSLMSRLVLVVGFLGLLFLAPLARQFVKGRMRKAGLWGKPVVVMSSGEPGESIAALLAREWDLGYKPIAVFGCEQVPKWKRFEATPDERSLAHAMELSRKHGVDTLVLAMPHTRRQQLARLVNWASFGFRHVMIIPNLGGVTNSAVVARDLAGTLGVEIRHNLLNPSVQRAKRALDLVAAVVGGILILPLTLVLALLVWLESGGPVFYSAERMGRDGKLFSCVKFRTMVPDAEAALRRMLEESSEFREEYSKYHKLRDDPRVTRVGRFLRKTSLDELPQLWNVLRGEMSLVGPRPYLPRESADIGVTQSEILRVYPGVTGPWQVSGRSSTSFSERAEIDAYYVRNWSIWLDLVILARTMRALLLDREAY